MRTIDINCDVGEGIGNEDQLMPYLSSCNIACGGHAGSIEIIDNTIRIAKENNVKIGAHPSFPDKENFGRKFVDMPYKTLQKSLEEQIGLLKKRVELQNANLFHIKAHGALYNALVINEGIANTFLNAVKNTVKNIILFVPFNSVIAKLALENDIAIKYEGFIDRNYNDDLSLVGRNNENAVITDKAEAFDHVSKMILEQRVKTINNREVPIQADTFCIHGDNKNALELLVYISKRLNELGINIDK